MQNLLTGAELKPPQSLTLMITDKCNLRCLHCWPESGPSEACRHVDKEKLLAMIGEFRMLGIEKICLTGGEPLLHPHWFDIVSFSCKEPGIKEVCLQTNATLLTRKNVRRLASCSSHTLAIQVSLEGASSRTHDKMRGVGSFTRALNGLSLLAENGLAEQTRVALTETEDNFQEIPTLLRLLQSLGISRFASGTLVHGGRAAKRQGRSLKPPAPEQYEMLLHRFHTDAVFHENYGKNGNVAPLEWYRGRATSSAPGCSFITNPYITADETLFPCVMFQIDQYAAHDVYTRPLAETLREIIPLWAKLQLQSRQRAELLEKCRTCPGRLHCRGGCMGRAYMAHGKLMAVEDRCNLRRVVYRWQDCSASLSGNKF